MPRPARHNTCPSNKQPIHPTSRPENVQTCDANVGAEHAPLCFTQNPVAYTIHVPHQGGSCSTPASPIPPHLTIFPHLAILSANTILQPLSLPSLTSPHVPQPLA